MSDDWEKVYEAAKINSNELKKILSTGININSKDKVSIYNYKLTVSWLSPEPKRSISLKIHYEIRDHRHRNTRGGKFPKG